MSKVIFNKAVLKVADGRTLVGTVTTEDDKIFLFKNTSTPGDVYFRLEKKNNSWQFACGPDYVQPQDFIDQIGRQINEL